MSQLDLARLIAHQGAMCLLQRLVSWDSVRIVLETDTHRAADHPLRRHGRLRAVHLCEYGAQAMAVHGALQAQAGGSRAPPGLLVSLRSVVFTRDYLEALTGSLRVEATCLQADTASLQYEFCVTHAAERVAQGRAAVMLAKR